MVSIFPSSAESRERSFAIFGTRTRFVLMILVLLCLTSIWSNILTFNIAVVCMAPSPNATAEQNHDRYQYTNNEKSWVMSIVAIAALISNFPVVYVVNRLGIRTMFTLLGILSGIATLLLPTFIRFGFGWLLVMRFFQGLAFSANFPVIGAFCSKWTYFKQMGLFSSFLVAYVQLAPAITNAVSGPICNQWGWPAIFYWHGAAGVFIFIIYGLFYRNSPNKHPFVGDIEVNKIATGKVTDKAALRAVPYKAILMTPAVWAVWIAAVGNFCAVNMEFLFNPTYLSQVLGFSVSETGISSAIPPFAQFLVKLICGGISDRIKFVSEQTKFRAFNTLAFFGSAAFFIALAFMNTENPNLNSILLSCAAGILGATTGGFFKASAVLSKQYSHFVTGNISLVITITMLIVPFYVNALTHNNTQKEWMVVFLITAGIQLVTNVIFVLLVKGEPCEWTKEEFVKRTPATSVSVNVADSTVKI